MVENIVAKICGDNRVIAIWEAVGQQNKDGRIHLIDIIQYYTERRWNSKFWRMIGR